MTPMPRLQSTDGADRTVPEPATSATSVAVKRLRHGVERWHTPAPDEAILLTSKETSQAIESFASETALDIESTTRRAAAAPSDLELRMFGAESLADLTIAPPAGTGPTCEAAAVADDAGVLAFSPPAPARRMIPHVSRAVAAAGLVVAALGGTIAFRETRRPAIVEAGPAAPPPVVNARDDLASSWRALDTVPLSSSVVAQALRPDGQELTEHPPDTQPAPSRASTSESIETPRALDPIPDRRTEVPAEAPPVQQAAAMPASGSGTGVPITVVPDAPPLRTPAVTPAAPPAAAAEPARTVAPPPSVVPRNDAAASDAIAAVLDRYRTAFNDLDAEAARSVWPGADVRGLGRAFDGLKEQQLSFDDCAITLRGDSAVADCRGTASYIPKVGRKTARVEARHWRFQVEKREAGWQIQSVAAR